MKKRLSFLLAVGMIIASAFPGVANATTIDDLEQAASEKKMKPGYRRQSWQMHRSYLCTGITSRRH